MSYWEAKIIDTARGKFEVFVKERAIQLASLTIIQSLIIQAINSPILLQKIILFIL
ncbi:hypothetical protein [Mesobacillus sp.]|uniref:hypothetical protein n=1 Tax=Mesobacillus sp. TaxID=2675271 RepID=UPI0026C76E07